MNFARELLQMQTNATRMCAPFIRKAIPLSYRSLVIFDTADLSEYRSQNLQLSKQQMLSQSGQMQREGSTMGMGQDRPQSPGGSVDNAPSPKRPRLDANGFNGPMGPAGRGQPQGIPAQVNPLSTWDPVLFLFSIVKLYALILFWCIWPPLCSGATSLYHTTISASGCLLLFSLRPTGALMTVDKLIYYRACQTWAVFHKVRP